MPVQLNYVNYILRVGRYSSYYAINFEWFLYFAWNPPLRGAYFSERRQRGITANYFWFRYGVTTMSVVSSLLEAAPSEITDATERPNPVNIGPRWQRTNQEQTR